MKFTINGTEYEGAKYDYNTHCDLKDMGIDISKFTKNPEGIIRAYLAVSSGMDLRMAGNEINEHLINGGSLDEIMEVLANEVNNSGFFQKAKDKKSEKEKSEK